jgi:transcriptional regulator GlxA family with amidase domain
MAESDLWLSDFPWLARTQSAQFFRRSAMKRRTFVSASLGAAALSGFGLAQVLPRRKRIRVAFMLGKGTNVIDTAGPWEVFQDVTVDGDEPFELFTVGPGTDLLTMTGGLQVKPRYGIQDAPQPNVIVVPAQGATDATREWLRKASAGTDVTMSVCTGAFQLARVGLLDGMPATTHHDFFDAFAKEFPKVELRRGSRFVDNGRVATAGGLTSGIDLALHIVARYFGADTAAATAQYMEYSSEAWRV